MGFLNVFLTWLLFARPLLAYVDPNNKSYCSAACVEALAHFAFAGDSGDRAFAYTPWVSTLRIDSVYLCMKIFCPSEDVTEGLGYLIGNCEPSTCPNFQHDYAEATSVSPATLSNLPRVNFDQIKLGLILNSTTVPSTNYYSYAFWTIARFYNNVTINKNYGHAMYGFWAGVVLIGIVSRLLTWIGNRGQAMDGSLVESGGANFARATGKLSISRRMSRLLDRYILVPATFRKRCRQPIGWFTFPSRMGSITILAFIIINVVLCALQYHLFIGNLYYPDKNKQFLRYFADRTGMLAFANLPVIWLFSARNNLFLWLTGWSFGTFNSFHRWIARITTLEAVLHALSYTAFDYVDGGGYSDLAQDWKAQYWYNGGIAMISMCLILAFSIYGLRVRYYEVFLFLHIGLAVIVLACCFYHVKIFEGQYNGYLWPCVAIWLADRFIRYSRLVILNFKAKRSGQRAKASYDEKSHIIRLDVPVWLASPPTPGTYYFLYTPTHWKGYESHPFTLAHWDYLSQTPRHSMEVPSRDADLEVEKHGMNITSRSIQQTESEPGVSNSISKFGGMYILSFMIRPYEGYTLRLRDKIMKTCDNGTNSIDMTILAEGPYGQESHLDKYDHVLFIMGGSGITVAISYLRKLLKDHTTNKTVRLVWSIKEPQLADGVLRNELSSLLAKANMASNISIDLYITSWDGQTRKIAKNAEDLHMQPNSEAVKIHYGRPDIANITELEARNNNASMAVMMSGPAQMADDTRSSIIKCIWSTKCSIKYYEEVFGW